MNQLNARNTDVDTLSMQHGSSINRLAGAPSL